MEGSRARASVTGQSAQSPDSEMDGPGAAGSAKGRGPSPPKAGKSAGSERCATRKNVVYRRLRGARNRSARARPSGAARAAAMTWAHGKRKWCSKWPSWRGCGSRTRPDRGQHFAGAARGSARAEQALIPSLASAPTADGTCGRRAGRNFAAAAFAVQRSSGARFPIAAENSTCATGSTGLCFTAVRAGMAPR